MTASCPFSPKELRQLILQHQGLLQPASGKAAVAQVLQQISYVQLDSIYVVERAHHHVLYNRVKNYQPKLLDKALQQKQSFEYWSHAASFLPAEDYRFSLQRKLLLQNGNNHWFKPEQQLMNEVLVRVEAEGPLKASDFAGNNGNAGKKNGAWWDWQPAKQALEQLFMQGKLMVARRDKFQKVYDLAERVWPDHAEHQAPTDSEFADYLIERCLQSQAVATVQQIGYLRKNMQLALKQQLKQQLEQGRLQTFLLDGKIYYYRPQLALTNKLPNKVPNKVWLLSPFDNLVIQRDRLKQLFNFDYQIEVYVPAAKRQIGYYSLPILYKDQFIGQVDVKADRASNTLLLQHLVLDEQVRLTDALKAALTKAVVDYASFNGCDSWQLIKANSDIRQWLLERL
ncbi:winged helix-turn-helix domain-containing protein [Rheinheimera tangshanensis]|uniref:Winged helix-turn-helix domain-containing protein n=1 Tax=Rheinheimera tangshanensis TaxID=400153 RepID=A0A5C8M3F7_9GAMM|nr:crosslink repair DNA glycosylase YcaQ family protein [Rheinheimera tangshanensis]TXK82953.1 winged helix-turn-helix domain-containing protein [Rheinheimera tangshanensis]GGM47527.1 hypothetical protein GCM10010920_04970 [Rheinheimera tangshanensis]